METTFEPQSTSSLSNISNESLEIDFCSISIPLEVDQNDDSFMDFFFEKEEENISSFLTSLFDSTKDESSDPEEIQQPKQSPKQTPLVLFPLTQPIANTCTNQSSPITTKPTIIHKPVPVRRNRGLYCRSFK